MKNLNTFELALEDGRQCFCGGEIMRGCVTVDFEDEAEMQNIQVRLYGEAFTQPNNIHGMNGKQKHRKKESVVDLKKILFGYKDGESVDTVPTHPHGVYRYDFQFLVPKYLPCSFESPKDRQQGLAFIHYFVEATITRPWKANVTRQMGITVNEVIDTSLPEYSYRPGCQTQKELGTCISDGMLSIEAYVDNICYNQGNSILISCEAENDSNRIMTSVYAKLFKRTRYRGKKETRTYVDVVAEYFGDRILPRNSVSWENLPFKIPKVGPTITRSNRINVDYYLRVGMYQLFREEIHVDLPIVIGVTKDYLIERRLTEEDLRLDVSVSVDPVTARESRLSEVDRRRLEDIADVFMRMPHTGKRPSVQYLNAWARKSRRQHSAESTPRQASHYDSEDSYTGDERLQVSMSADLLQSGYYENPSHLSASGLSSRRASETNLYTATKSDLQPRVLASTPTPRTSAAGSWTKSSTPRQMASAGARPVRKAVSNSNIEQRSLAEPESADGHVETQGLSPRKSPGKRPSIRKTASQGKVDMKEAAMIAAGIGNIRRKGTLKIKSQNSDASNDPEITNARSERKEASERLMRDAKTDGVATDKEQSKMANANEAAATSKQSGQVESGQFREEKKETPTTNRLKNPTKMPTMSPIHSAADSGPESPGKKPGGSSLLQLERQRNDLNTRQKKAPSGDRIVAKAGSTVEERRSSSGQSNAKAFSSNSKVAAVAAFRKGSKSFTANSKKRGLSTSATKSPGSGKTASDGTVFASSQKSSSSRQVGARAADDDPGRKAKHNESDLVARGSTSANIVQRASRSRQKIEEKSLKELKENEVNNNASDFAEDDEIIPVSEQNTESMPDFDFSMMTRDENDLQDGNAEVKSNETGDEFASDVKLSSSQMLETTKTESQGTDLSKADNQIAGKQILEDSRNNEPKTTLSEAKEIVEEGEIVARSEREGLENAPAYSLDEMDLDVHKSIERRNILDYTQDEVANEETLRSTQGVILKRASSLDEFERFETEMLSTNADSNGGSIEAGRTENHVVPGDSVNIGAQRGRFDDDDLSSSKESSKELATRSVYNGFAEYESEASNPRGVFTKQNGDQNSKFGQKAKPTFTTSNGNVNTGSGAMTAGKKAPAGIAGKKKEMANEGLSYDFNGIDIEMDTSQLNQSGMYRDKSPKQTYVNLSVDENQNKADRESRSSGGEAWRRSFTKIRSIPVTEKSRRSSIVSIKVVEKDSM